MEIDFDELEINNPENKYNLPENLIYINDLAQGAFGKVIHARETITKKDYALKIINKSESNTNDIDKMKEEILILKKLNHENIVKYYGHIETINQLFIKMEYLKYGTLADWMKKNKNISEEEASLIIKKVLSAIAYLHQNQICHRDLKPENIMFSKENDLNSIKIIDFGLSLQNFDSLFNSDYCGTLIYMAPEQIERKSYYLSVDIWSIGILMFMLLHKGKHPFYDEKDTKEIFLRNLKEYKKLEFDNKISFMAMHLLKKMLEYDPSKRYKAIDALKHPWITRNPQDKIPQTFNEQLNNISIINNAKKLMMISIFLNYLKKSNDFCMNKMKKKQKECIKSKSTLYKINDEYIKKCEYFSRTKRDKLKEIKMKYLDIKKDSEKSEEKENNNSNANTNSTSNNNLSISNSSKSNNNYSIQNSDVINFLNINKRKKLSINIPRIKKDNPLMSLELNNLTTKRTKKKIFFSESKKSNKLNSNIKGKKINLENSLSKNHLTESADRRFLLMRASSKNLNKINDKDIGQKTLNFINENINSIKPINLFLRDKNLAKLNVNNGIIIPFFQLGKIIKQNTKVKKENNFVHNNKLPNINQNNIYNHRRSKRNIKYIFN